MSLIHAMNMLEGFEPPSVLLDHGLGRRPKDQVNSSDGMRLD
jgi:hypothetical protein